MRIILTILFFTWVSANATTYYVAEAGNDSNAGTDSLHAFLTLTKVGTVANALGGGDIVYFHRGGTYFGTVTDLSSGVSGSLVLFRDYGDKSLAKPLLLGSVALTSWTPVSGLTNIWEAAVNSGLMLDLVTINGVMTPMGRTPNIGQPYYNVDSHNTNGQQITSTSIGSPNYVGAYVVMRTKDYVTDRNLITAQSGTTISFPQQGINVISDNSKFFFQGALSCLDQQNEWYYNSAAHTLRMYSTVNPSTLNVRAGTQTYAFSDDPIGYVKFSNLAFTGFDSIPIRLDNAPGIIVDSCDFYNIGSDAFSSRIGVGAIVSNCTFNNIGNSAIVTRYASGVLFEKNYTNHCGVIEGMGLGNNQQKNGIMHENANYNSGSGDIIRFNTILNSGYCGIRFSGNGTKVYNNYVDSFGLQLTDAGGIYTCCNGGETITREVYNNVVHYGYGNHAMSPNSTPGGMPAIYYDDGTIKVKTYNNTMSAASRYLWYGHNVEDQEVYGNNFYGDANVTAGIGVEDDALDQKVSGINIHDNTFYGINTKYQVYFLTYGTSSDNPISSFGNLANNTYIRSSGTAQFGANPGGDYTLSGWQSAFSWDGGSTYNPITDDSMRLVSNNTSATVPVTLGTSVTYRDASGTNYTNTISLPAFSSAILRQVTYIPVSGGTVIFTISNIRRKKTHKIVQ